MPVALRVLREPQDERDKQGRADEEELRRRLRELLYTTPEERRLLIEAARVLRGEKGSKAEERAAVMKAAMDLLGDQFLPETEG